MVPLPGWVAAWVAISSFLVALDCLYVLSIERGVLAIVPKVVADLWAWYGTSDSQYAATGAGLVESNGWMATQVCHFCVYVCVRACVNA
jgi:hypothetical protein